MSDGARAAALAAGFDIESGAAGSTRPGGEAIGYRAVDMDAGEAQAAGAGGDSTVVGGTWFYTVRDGMPMFCNTGFNGTDRDGNVVNITGSHCDRTDSDSGESLDTVAREIRVARMLPVTPGQFSASTLGPEVGELQVPVDPAVDHRIIRIGDAAAARFRNNLIGVRDGVPIAIDGIADPVLGAPVCKSGGVTGFACGIVTSVDEEYTNNQGTYRHGAIASIFLSPGDSGGPLISGTKAVGIAGNVGGSVKRPVFNALTFQPIRAILDANPGLRLRTD
ncbi:S1 family peptidase [Nocardia sp. NPDC051030]|uniref:S1 family peptidase n=1 Tax=Nocardia sp. NPDC051030 TaxID=3155162 RepID=UPI0034457098